MFEPAPSVREPLAAGLVLRAVESGGEVERLADFNGRIHGEDVTVLTRRLLLDHPRTRARHWLLVEEPSSGRIVSSLCLIPWSIRLDGVELRAGEMGIVGTEPEHRRGGLIRALVARFDRILADEGFDLSHIQGIPYFYRQFGYQYAVPLIPDLRLPLDAMPEEPVPAGVRFRPAGPADLPALSAAYTRLASSSALWAVREEATWSYLLGGETAGEGETWCVEREGAVAGYFRTHRRGFGQGLIVSEASPLGARLDAALLAELSRRARAAGKPYVKLEMDPACEVAGIARSLGAHAMRTYAWQIRFVDLAALLRKLAPALERRLEASAFAGLSERLVVSLYREAFALDWRRGTLAAVERLQPPAEAAPVQLPPETVVPLLLGHRSLPELADWHPDVRVEPRAAALLEALFPKLRSYLYTIY